MARALSREKCEGFFIERGEDLKLRNINPALPRLALRDKGLGAAEFLGDLRLGKMGGQPGLFEAAEKLSIVVSVDAGHYPSLTDGQCYYSVLGYPKIG